MSFPTALFKAGVLALGLAGAFVGGWEAYWRGRGFGISYNDDESLWASQRRRIYQSTPAGPVVIGSSRIKFDLDQPTWRRLTGRPVVQLALVGTSPRPVLTDLGNDPNFRGSVIVDVVEGLFFAPTGSRQEQRARVRLKAYPKWSLAQQASFYLNRALEARLVFLNEDELTLDSFLGRLRIPNRAQVFSPPVFPLKFAANDLDRQTRMTTAFVADTAMHTQMRRVWMRLGGISTTRGPGGDTLTALLASVKHSVDQIRGRGGRVLFVRCPSDGPFWAAEQKGYPRARYWDRLLATTGAPGIHFQDYPALARFRCPEWSHLTPADAVRFTEGLVPLVEKGLGIKDEGLGTEADASGRARSSERLRVVARQRVP